MRRYNINLDARNIDLSKEEKELVSGIAQNKLNRVGVYTALTPEIQSIIKTNVLIVATTDNTKRAEDKADIIIGNLSDAISLVMKDLKEGSANILEE